MSTINFSTVINLFVMAAIATTEYIISIFEIICNNFLN